MSTTRTVLVNRRASRKGQNPLLTAKPMITTEGKDGRLYIRIAGRWWKLSNGDQGWHSFNVGMPDGFDPLA